jgi:mono/diheme cytochrome c family protein
MNRGAAAWLAAGMAFGIFCLASEAQASKPKPTPDLLRLGKKSYQNQCAVCHGAAGAGDGSAAYLLYPKPRNFTSNNFRLVSTTEMQATDEDLFKTITGGMPGSSMPSWSHLSERERWGLVFYVRYLAELKNHLKPGETLENALAKELPWPRVREIVEKQIDPSILISVPAEPPTTPQGLEAGKALFKKACAACHGLEGKGDGQQMMNDSEGYLLKPRDLTAGIFKGSSKSEDLYYRINAGIPGSPMPGYQGIFPDEEIWNLIHYVQTLPKAGAEERSRVRRHSLTAKKVDSVDLDPLSDDWLSSQGDFVALMPLWWRDERVEGLEVKAVHDGKTLAVYLSWEDATQDDSNVTIQSFSDGAAIQWTAAKEPGSFAMGSAKSPVTIWNWKAARQESAKEWKDIESAYPHAAVDWYEADKTYQRGSPFEAKSSKTPFHDPKFTTGWGAGNPLSDPEVKTGAEQATARGLGTLTTQRPKIEPIKAHGVWKDGRWQVVFWRSLKVKEAGSLSFDAGKSVNAAFAVWDGSKKDRNGQKMVSIWNDLSLER